MGTAANPIYTFSYLTTPPTQEPFYFCSLVSYPSIFYTADQLFSKIWTSNKDDKNNARKEKFAFLYYTYT